MKGNARVSEVRAPAIPASLENPAETPYNDAFGVAQLL